MIFRMIWLLLTFLPMMSPLQAALFGTKPPVTGPATIKLLVVHDKPGVVLEVKGRYKLFDPNTKDHISTRFVGKRKFIQAVKDGLKWGEEFPGVYQLLAVPDSSRTTIIADGVEYRGAIYVYDIGGTVSIVNEVPLDEYLNSMLAPQYATSELSDEALNALVIAARTQAYYMNQHPGSQYWAADARKIGYQGYAMSSPNSRLAKSIEKTRNMVLSKDEAGAGADSAAIAAFPAVWGISSSDGAVGSQSVPSAISLVEADDLAKKGELAAQILHQAFPNTSLKVIK